LVTISFSIEFSVYGATIVSAVPLKISVHLDCSTSTLIRELHFNY